MPPPIPLPSKGWNLVEDLESRCGDCAIRNNFLNSLETPVGQKFAQCGLPLSQVHGVNSSNLNTPFHRFLRLDFENLIVKKNDRDRSFRSFAKA